jgi:hypothetical protein
MIRYQHGSKDSLDKDMLYVFDEMPSFKECQEFCSDKEENRNIIVVKDGIVTNCFKGTVDEINNGLFNTYKLHEQEYPLIITRKVERNELIKAVRVLRCLISHCSRTSYREGVKKAMRSPSWKERIAFAKSIDYANITDYDKNGSLEDTLKIFAFQIAQSLSLFIGEGIYTKGHAANVYPKLRKYLYREPNADRTDIAKYIESYLDILDCIEVEEDGELCYFPQLKCLINLRTEEYI